MTDSLLLSAQDFARALRVSVRTLYRLRSAGRLPRPLELGGSVRWRRDEVQAWLEAGAPRLEEWESRKRSDARA
jgi:excisionase family DNA binding protein